MHHADPALQFQGMVGKLTGEGCCSSTACDYFIFIFVRVFSAVHECVGPSEMIYHKLLVEIPVKTVGPVKWESLDTVNLVV